jgi:hypothetical protein
VSAPTLYLVSRARANTRCCSDLRRLRTRVSLGAWVSSQISSFGVLLVCPICFDARRLDESALVPNARLGGATPLWEWIGTDDAAVFSY